MGDGTWYCWGQNDLGQLTDGGSTIDRASPVEMQLGGLRPATLGLADAASCLVAPQSAAQPAHEDSWIYCWGPQGLVALPTGGGVRRSPDALQPVPVGTSLLCSANRVCRGFAMVAVGVEHACGLYRGANFVRQPRPGEPEFTPFAEVVSCWGRNAAGQVAAGAPDPVTFPEDAYLVGTESIDERAVTDLVATARTSCAGARGRLVCWGGGFGAAPAVVLDGIVPGSVAVAREIDQVCALRAADGMPLCGRFDNAGNAVRGFMEADLGLGGVPPLQAIAVGGAEGAAVHGCGVTRREGAVWCWGGNDQGQRGIGHRGAANTASVSRIAEPDTPPQPVP